MLTQAIYNLAAYPEYIKGLREEIEPLVAREGWERATVMKMWKLDSFIKESLRLSPLGAGISVSLNKSYCSRRLQSCGEAIYILEWSDCTCWGHAHNPSWSNPYGRKHIQECT